MMQQFCDWLAGTALSQVLQATAWIIPMIQTLHILCIAAVVGAMGMLGLRMLGIGWRDQTIQQVGRRFLPWMWRALPVLAATGLLMIIAEPLRSLPNTAFQLKMLLLLAVIVLSLIMDRAVTRGGAIVAESALARMAGLFILIAWTGIVVAGRWIAYL